MHIMPWHRTEGASDSMIHARPCYPHLFGDSQLQSKRGAAHCRSWARVDLATPPPGAAAPHTSGSPFSTSTSSRAARSGHSATRPLGHSGILLDCSPSQVSVSHLTTLASTPLPVFLDPRSFPRISLRTFLTQFPVPFVASQLLFGLVLGHDKVGRSASLRRPHRTSKRGNKRSRARARARTRTRARRGPPLCSAPTENSQPTMFCPLYPCFPLREIARTFTIHGIR